MIGTSPGVAAHAREVHPQVVAGGLLEVEGRSSWSSFRLGGVWMRTLASMQAGGGDEDQRPDHVDLRRHADARGAPDVERERDRRARVEVA